MFKLRFVPLAILVILLLVLIFFQSWTFYLGTTDVTFERLLGTKPYKEIKEISLRRYKKGVFSPHLFTITSDNESATIEHFTRDCAIQRTPISKLPTEVKETDKEMVEVIEKSPYLYLSKTYDLQDPKAGRMCLLFRDTKKIYLFINGNL